MNRKLIIDIWQRETSKISISGVFSKDLTRMHYDAVFREILDMITKEEKEKNNED